MSEPFLRDMRREDIEQVLNIERLSFTSPWSEASFIGEISNGHSIVKVAEINGRIAGFICLRNLYDEIHIMDLAVHPELRRIGIARLLFYNALSLIKNQDDKLYLEVRASNSPARCFYAGLGFSVIGIRKKYYINPEEDAVLMARNRGED